MATSSVAEHPCTATPVHFSPAEPRRPQQAFDALIPLPTTSAADIRDKIERAIIGRCADVDFEMLREWCADLTRQSEREFAMKRELAFARFATADRLEMIVDGYADLTTKERTRDLRHMEEAGEWDFALTVKSHLERIDALLGPPPLRVQAEFDIEHHRAKGNQ